MSRVLLFLIVGIFNTVLIRPEDIGSLKNYLGYVLLLLGVFDAFFLIIRYFKHHKSEQS